MRVLVTDAADPLLRDVYVAISDDYRDRYGPGGATYVLRDDAAHPGQFTEPLGGVVLLVDGEAAVAAAAWTRHDATTARVKRVWTDASRRRQGLSRQILTELEAVVRDRGFTSMVLTTGPRQPEAVKLYLATGWTPADVPGADSFERGFAKRL